MFDAFLSYSRRDEAFAVKLRRALDAAGKTLWLDKRDIQPAEDWRSAAFTGIDSAHNFLFVITPDSVKCRADGSPAPCGEELARAVASGKRLIPIHYLATPHATVAKDLRDLNDIDFRNTDDDPAAFDRACETLLTAMTTDLAWVAQHTLLQVRASDWQSKAKDPSALLRGDQLRSAEAWLSQPQSPGQRIKPTPLQVEYLTASRAAETRSQRLRTRIAAAVAAFSLTLAAIALVMFFRARTEARIATAGRLAAIALSLRDTQLDLAALLSVEASHIANTFDTRNAQLILFQSTPTLLTHLHLYNPARHDFNAVQSISFTRDGARFATGSADGILELWSTASLERVWMSRERNLQDAMVALSPDGTRLAAFYLDGPVELWDTSTHPHILSAGLPGAPAHPSSLAFDRTGNLLAVSGQGGVQVWFLPSLQPLRPPGPPNLFSRSVAFSPVDPTLLAFSTDRAIRLEDSATSTPRGQIPYPQSASPAPPHDPNQPIAEPASQDSQFGNLAFSPDGTQIAVDAGPQGVALWRLTPHGRQQTASLQARLPIGDGGIVMGIAFNPDGSRLVATSSHGAMREWSLPSLVALPDYPASLAVTNYSAAYGPHGLLFSGLKSGTIFVWDQANTSMQQIPLAARTFAGFTADSRSVLLADAKQSLVCWNIEARAMASSPCTPATSPAPDTAAVIHGNAVELHDRDRVTALTPALSSLPQAAALSPDRRFAAATAFSDKGVLNPAVPSRLLWDLGSSAPRPIPLRGPDYGTFGLTFNPAGTLLATTGFRGLFLWRTKDGILAGSEIQENRKPVLRAAFNPAGDRIALYIDDGQVSLVDLPTRNVFGLPLQPDLHAWAATPAIGFSPNGKLLAFTGPNQSVMLWNADPAAWKDRPCRLANRNLTLLEWKRYLGDATPYRRTCPNLPGPDPPNPK